MSDDLESARAKLTDASAGALTQDEIQALLSATVPQRTHGTLMEALAEQILDLTEEYPRDKAKPVLIELLKDKVHIIIEKVWDEGAFQDIA